MAEEEEEDELEVVSDNSGIRWGQKNLIEDFNNVKYSEANSEIQENFEDLSSNANFKVK